MYSFIHPFMLAVSQALWLALVNFGAYHISVVGRFVDLMPRISLCYGEKSAVRSFLFWSVILWSICIVTSLQLLLEKDRSSLCFMAHYLISGIYYSFWKSEQNHGGSKSMCVGFFVFLTQSYNLIFHYNGPVLLKEPWSSHAQKTLIRYSCLEDF